MATITIKSASDDILQRVRHLAGDQETNIEREALDCLERGLREREEIEQTLERLRKLRASMPNAWLTEEFLREAKNERRL